MKDITEINWNKLHTLQRIYYYARISKKTINIWKDTAQYHLYVHNTKNHYSHQSFVGQVDINIIPVSHKCSKPKNIIWYRGFERIFASMFYLWLMKIIKCFYSILFHKLKIIDIFSIFFCLVFFRRK